MPNHCENDLYISGPKEQVAALLTTIGADQPEPKFDFNAVIAYPTEYAQRDQEAKELGWKGLVEKYGEGATDGYNSGGYEWCCANWGTKWSAYEVLRRDYGGICLTFRTAWAPPEPVLIGLHKKFPLCTLNLEYFERGGAFCGGFTLLSEDDWYEDKPWAPGMKTSEWRGNYSGHRGG